MSNDSLVMWAVWEGMRTLTGEIIYIGLLEPEWGLKQPTRKRAFSIRPVNDLLAKTYAKEELSWALWLAKVGADSC